MNIPLKFFLNLTMIQAVNARRYDARLSTHGIGLNNFMILFHLGEAPDEKLRRIDLAEKIGLTASGVTRMLKTMEKIGLVQREKDPRDARVSNVKLAPGGKRVLKDAMASAERTSDELFRFVDDEKLKELSDVLVELGGTIS